MKSTMFHVRMFEVIRELAWFIKNTSCLVFFKFDVSKYNGYAKHANINKTLSRLKFIKLINYLLHIVKKFSKNTKKKW